MKQIDKTWVPTYDGQSGYLKRTHDQARSPLERLCATPDFDARRAQALRTQRDAINPLQLRRAIYAGLEHLFAYPNAQPDQVQDVFQTLADPDLFPNDDCSISLDKGEGYASVTLPIDLTHGYEISLRQTARVCSN